MKNIANYKSTKKNTNSVELACILRNVHSSLKSLKTNIFYYRNTFRNTIFLSLRRKRISHIIV